MSIPPEAVFLVSSGPAPVEDLDLDILFQATVAGITGLDPTLVRPRWQPIPPKRPDQSVNWCAVGVTVDEPCATPSIEHVGETDTDPAMDVLTQHETIEVVVTFYGPNAKQYSRWLRNGLALPQNMQALQANDIYFGHRGPSHGLVELVNEIQVRRWDTTYYFNRKVTDEYAVPDAAGIDIQITDDTGHVNRTINVTVPPPE